MSNEQKQIQEQEISPLVKALTDYAMRVSRITEKPLAAHVEDIAAIVAEHQPPDKYDELQAAVAAYSALRGDYFDVVLCLDGSGALLGDESIWKRNCLVDWRHDDDPAAAIRAATEKLKPKPEPCQLCAGRRALLCDACGGAVSCPRCSTATPNP